MDRIRLLRFALLPSLAALAGGCASDPLAGSWESEYDTNGQRDVFTLEEVDDQVEGDGTWYSAIPGTACPVSIVARETDADGVYVGSISGAGPCAGATYGFDCVLLDGDERIDCGGGDTYRRTD